MRQPPFRNQREEALHIIVSKAVKNGWGGDDDELREYKGLDAFYEDVGRVCLIVGRFEDQRMMSLEAMIFNHGFAQALWGDYVYRDCASSSCTHIDEYYPARGDHRHFGWEYHIKQLAVAKDRIIYLSQFCD